ncbi:MAG: hypothetical protein Ta2B_11710 [Termitinemataceae bacterium]|nr:MAG: hypothetical protein Ta2B_11710 [Termitinemataceae bacterium]
MEAGIQYKIIHCGGCERFICAVKCKNAVLVLTHGNLIIDTSKCGTGDCKYAKDSGGKKKNCGIPECVGDCKYSTEKNIVPVLDENKKREAALVISPLVSKFVKGHTSKKNNRGKLK